MSTLILLRSVGYSLGKDVERLLILLALYKLRALIEQSMRLRTACDLKTNINSIKASSPNEFPLPALSELIDDLKTAITRCNALMQVTVVAFEDKLKKAKEDKSEDTENANDESESED